MYLNRRSPYAAARNRLLRMIPARTDLRPDEIAEPEPPAEWTPPDASVGTKLWYRADLGVTVAGGLVSALADQSGLEDAGRDQSASGADRPGYIASDPTYGDQSVLTFDGTQRMLSSIFDSFVDVPICVTLIGEIDSDSAAFSDGLSGNMIFKSGGNVYFYGAAQGPSPGGAGVINVPCCIMFTDDGSPSADAAKIFVNDLSTPVATGPTNWGTATSFNLGLDVVAVGRLVGKIAETIVFGDIPTAPDFVDLVDYLNTSRAYGIPVA